MEIIHVVLGKANPERMNGVNKVVHELASHQAAKGWMVSVWGLTADLEHNYPPRSYNTRLFLKQSWPFRLSREIVQAVRSVKAGAVFHLHGGFLPQMYSLSRLLDKLNIPFVCTPHGSYNHIAMNKNRLIKKMYFLLFEKHMLHRAGAIHILGQSERSSLGTWNSFHKVIQIPYGFEPAAMPAPITRNRQEIFVIGFCGRVDIYTKGLDALIDGFALFHSEYPASELRIIGDGKEMPELQQMVQQSPAAGSILLYGAKYGIEKYELLCHFEVFAHPSRNEGLPAAVLEAAAAGIPCLVTRATNTGEEISRCHAGTMIEHTDKQDIYEGIKALYIKIREEQAGESIARQAQQMIRKAFNWDFLLKNYENMYQSILT